MIMIMLSYFPDMTYKKRKNAISFRNSIHENKLFKVVKSIVRWLLDTLESVKEENGKVFLGNNIAQIISEISGISKIQKSKFLT